MSDPSSKCGGDGLWRLVYPGFVFVERVIRSTVRPTPLGIPASRSMTRSTAQPPTAACHRRVVPLTNFGTYVSDRLVRFPGSSWHECQSIAALSSFYDDG